MMRLQTSFAAVSLVVLMSCGGSSDGGSPGGGPDGGNPGQGSASHATSTVEERNQLCSLGVPKCGSYPTVGDCLADHQRVAECFVTTVYQCVKALGSCVKADYDGCMTQGIGACEPGIPDYVQQCLDKNDSCKSQYSDPAGVGQNVEDSCHLLAAMDDKGRADGAQCVAGACADLERCIVKVTP